MGLPSLKLALRSPASKSSIHRTRDIRKTNLSHALEKLNFCNIWVEASLEMGWNEIVSPKSFGHFWSKVSLSTLKTKAARSTWL